jgi:hypothetical protein
LDKYVVFWIVVFLLGGPFLALLFRDGSKADAVTTAWGKSWLFLIKWGAIAGVVVFAYLLLEKLFR